MTTHEAVEVSLPIAAYHRKCAYEMQRLKYQRRQLTAYIEARKAGALLPSPLLIKLDLDKIWKMVQN